MNARSLAPTLGFVLLAASGGAGAQTPGVAIHSVSGSFDDVKERVVMAIEARGMVLNYTAKIGDMLERTGKDIGRDRPIYAKAELLEFCSSKLSRDAMEADARNIVFCPYAIAVYSMERDAKKVYVSYRKLGSLGSGQSIKALRAVDRLLEEIVREAMQ
ncbi:MAG: DUF302 domain-containing protein [Betaproteobacteria bacterium]|nr:DUF302 domain-containing protein [Betaproteobacteria bacterium]